MGIFNKLSFVRDEIKTIVENEKKPDDVFGSFSSRIGYALSLGLKEKEIILFGILQWASIGAGYLLWVQMLDWIPEEVWRSAAETEGSSIADWVLLAWSFFCVGVVAYPVGILTGCMGAAHFLHKQGRESTIAACLKLVLPQSWPLWSFHWIDGWLTVNQILDRLPRKNDSRSSAQKAADEALYYAWKVGVAGVLPSILTGNGLIRSGKNSIMFVKDNFVEVATLRAGYSAFCWIVGVAAYVGVIFLFINLDIVPKGDEVYGYIYKLYFWAAIPILIATAAVMLLLRPIYVITICDLYSDYLDQNGYPARLPENPAKGVSAMVAFMSLCVILGIVFVYRVELGIVDMLSTPFK